MRVKDFGARTIRRSWTPLVFSSIAVVGALGALLFTAMDLAGSSATTPSGVRRRRFSAPGSSRSRAGNGGRCASNWRRG